MAASLTSLMGTRAFGSSGTLRTVLHSALEQIAIKAGCADTTEYIAQWGAKNDDNFSQLLSHAVRLEPKDIHVRDERAIESVIEQLDAIDGGAAVDQGPALPAPMLVGGVDDEEDVDDGR